MIDSDVVIAATRGSTWEPTHELVWLKRGRERPVLNRVWHCIEDGRRDYRPVETIYADPRDDKPA